MDPSRRTLTQIFLSQIATDGPFHPYKTSCRIDDVFYKMLTMVVKSPHGVPRSSRVPDIFQYLVHGVNIGEYNGRRHGYGHLGR